MKVILVIALVAIPIANCALGDTFGSGAIFFDIDFVTIGDPGNPADKSGNPNSVGSVPYTYRMGKYEISEQMIDKANAESFLKGIPLEITAELRGPDKPATGIDWFEAAKFVNWLNTSTGNPPAYKFDDNGDFQLWTINDAGYDANNLYRNRLAKYFLPSVYEWYKAAYYDPIRDVYYGYPIGSDSIPTPTASGTEADTAVYIRSFASGPADITLAGGLSPYGTMAQGGNVFEWEETNFNLVNGPISDARGVRGGGWRHGYSDLSSSNRFVVGPLGGIFKIGFRVASVAIPEPSSHILSIALFIALAIHRRNRMQSLGV